MSVRTYLSMYHKSKMLPNHTNANIGFLLTPFSAYDKLDPRLVTGNAGKTTMEMILLFLFWFCPFLFLKKNQVGPE